MNIMKNNLIVSAVVAVLVSGAVVYFFYPSVKSAVADAVEQIKTFGSASSPSVVGGCMDINGVTRCYASQTQFNSASSTLCSLRSPRVASSSVLVSATYSVRTGTSTAIVYNFGKSSTPSATTTVLGNPILEAAAAVSGQVVATSTGASMLDWKFTDGQYLNLKIGGDIGSGLSNSLKGNCSATWEVIY